MSELSEGRKRGIAEDVLLSLLTHVEWEHVRAKMHELGWTSVSSQDVSEVFDLIYNADIEVVFATDD